MPIRINLRISTIAAGAARTGQPASRNLRIRKASLFEARQLLALPFAEAL